MASENLVPPGSQQQPNAPRNARNTMSTEARSVLVAKNRTKAQNMRDDISAVWESVDKAVLDIGDKYSRTALSIQQAIGSGAALSARKHNKINPWCAYLHAIMEERHDEGQSGGGRHSLPDLSRGTKEHYDSLSQAEIDEYVEQLRVHKLATSTGVRVSTKSKLMDIRHTTGHVQRELANLEQRTGLQSMLVMARSSTDLPFHPHIFSTARTEDFLPSTMKIDTNDFTTRFEGHAIQGLDGAIGNYKKTVSWFRAEIRRDIDKGLQAITENLLARMKWKGYETDIVQLYLVYIAGWPNGIPFNNLSLSSNGKPALIKLLKAWKDGTALWQRLTPAEALERKRKLEISYASGSKKAPAPRKERSDRGKSRKRIHSEQENDSETEAGPSKRRAVEYEH